jgi:hypothetical protein
MELNNQLRASDALFPEKGAWHPLYRWFKSPRIGLDVEVKRKIPASSGNRNL